MTVLDSTFLVWSNGGVLLWILALVSFMIFALFFRAFFSITPLLSSAEELSGELEGCGGDPEHLLRILGEHNDWIRRAYLKILTAMKHSDPMLESLESIERGCVETQSRDLLVLSAFTAAAPLLGLLGTVTGMIETFNATANISGETGQQIASGISQALLTTQFGLVIALPGVFGIAHLRKRIRDLETRLSQCRILISGAVGSRVGSGPEKRGYSSNSSPNP